MKNPYANHKLANVSWNPEGSPGQAASWQTVQVAVLMDIRAELQRLNELLHCANFTDIPRKLDAIKRSTACARRKAVKA